MSELLPLRDGFRYKRIIGSSLDHVTNFFPKLSQMAERGVAPRIEKVNLVQENGFEVMELYIENLDGIDLRRFVKHDGPNELFKGVKFTRPFAKGVAELCLEMFHMDVYQWDFHLGNIMYIPKTCKFMVVDLETVVPRMQRSGPIPMSDYVCDFSQMIGALYTQSSPLLLARRYEQNVEGNRDILHEQLIKQDVYRFVDGRILEFISRGLSEVTAPDRFDDIINL